MHNSTLIKSESTQVSKIIIYGSLGISVVLATLLSYADIFLVDHLEVWSLLSLGTSGYLVATLVIYNKRHFLIANWLIIILYGLVSFFALSYWGLQMPAGVFTTSFVIILSSILLGPRVIFPTLICIILFLIFIQTAHQLGIITPTQRPLPRSALLDVVHYSVIFAGFSLVTWVFGRQIERSLLKVATAEATVRAQKESIAVQLEKESSKLREAQMKEIQQLYKFAMIGQSSAATLHELSSHLSVLNMDIDDIKQHHQNSQAVANAEESIAQINSTLRQVKRRLGTFNNNQAFHGLSVIRQAAKDMKEKYQQKNVRMRISRAGSSPDIITGDPLALMQALTILLTNALDACASVPNPTVDVATHISSKRLTIRISDNGTGMSDDTIKHLFTPLYSTKPSGMGVGLYIAKHLIETQLKGTIILESSSRIDPHGTSFFISINVSSKVNSK